MFRLSGDPNERAFLNLIIRKSGQNLLECLQCGKCTAGCPIASEKVPGPRQLIAAILSGMKESALANPTWLYCVSCGTCATRCPVEINMYAVATALCETADKEKSASPVPEIDLFEELFLNSVRKNGRVQELNTVAQYNLRTFKPFKDLSQGLSLMRKGAISPSDMLKGSKKNVAASGLFAKVHQVRQGE
jgi:heterodisulfide reductase subunit C